MKPYYEHGGITIYHGDCREIVPALPKAWCSTCSCSLQDEQVLAIHMAAQHSVGPLAEAALTDPPYGVNKAEWDSQFPEWCFETCAAHVPVFGIMPGVWNIPACREKVAGAAGWLRYKWMLIAHLVNGMTNGAIGFGNYIPCLLYSTDDVSLHKADGDIKDFTVGSEPKQDHPSPKPLNVVKWFLSRLPGDSVIDPFMGSSSTLRAAKDLGRRAIGIEIEEKYCEIAAKRLSQEVFDFK